MIITVEIWMALMCPMPRTCYDETVMRDHPLQIASINIWMYFVSWRSDSSYCLCCSHLFKTGSLHWSWMGIADRTGDARITLGLIFNGFRPVSDCILYRFPPIVDWISFLIMFTKYRTSKQTDFIKDLLNLAYLANSSVITGRKSLANKFSTM